MKKHREQQAQADQQQHLPFSAFSSSLFHRPFTPSGTAVGQSTSVGLKRWRSEVSVRGTHTADGILNASMGDLHIDDDRELELESALQHLTEDYEQDALEPWENNEIELESEDGDDLALDMEAFEEEGGIYDNDCDFVADEAMFCGSEVVAAAAAVAKREETASVEPAAPAAAAVGISLTDTTDLIISVQNREQRHRAKADGPRSKATTASSRDVQSRVEAPPGSEFEALVEVGDDDVVFDDQVECEVVDDGAPDAVAGDAIGHLDTQGASECDASAAVVASQEESTPDVPVAQPVESRTDMNGKPTKATKKKVNPAKQSPSKVAKAKKRKGKVQKKLPEEKKKVAPVTTVKMPSTSSSESASSDSSDVSSGRDLQSVVSPGKGSAWTQIKVCQRWC